MGRDSFQYFLTYTTSTFNNSELQEKRNENLKALPSEIYLEQKKSVKQRPLLKVIVCIFTHYKKKHNILCNCPRKANSRDILGMRVV